MKKPNGRPPRYSPELASKVLARLAEGESLTAICRDPKMPSRTTVTAWVVDDVDGFADGYARARLVSYERMADELIEISDDSSADKIVDAGGREVIDHEAIARSRLRVDTRKWLLAKMLPKIYGDRVHAELSGPGGGPVRHSIELSADQAARIASEYLRAQQQVAEDAAG